MKLDDFVAETLKQLIDGVTKAQEYGRKNKTEVNPASAYLPDGKDHFFCSHTNLPINKIVFDVALL